MYICFYPKSIKRKSLESIRNSYKITQDKKRGKKRPRDIKKIMLKSEQIEWFQSVCLCWVDRDREDYREKNTYRCEVDTHKKTHRKEHPLNTRIYYFCLVFFVSVILPIVIYARFELCFPAFNRKESFIDRSAAISNRSNAIHGLERKHEHKTSLSLKHGGLKNQNENFKQILYSFCFLSSHGLVALCSSRIWRKKKNVCNLIESSYENASFHEPLIVSEECAHSKLI